MKHGTPPKWTALDGEKGIEKRKLAGRNIEYRARITVVVDGKRKQVTRQATTASDARKAKTDLLIESRTGGGKEKIDPKKLTFAQLADEYASDHLIAPVYDNEHSDNRSKQDGIVGVKDGERAIKVFKAWFGDHLVSDIKKQQIRKWKTARLKEPKMRGGGMRSLASVNGELRFLYGAFKFAIEAGYINQNPCRGLIDQKNENKRTRVLTFDETTRLLDAANETLKPFLIFLLHTAARCGEARQVERRDINLKKNVIVLRKRTTKAKAQRDIPILTPELREVIEERLAVIASDPHALLFPKTYDYYEYWFQAAAKQAKINSIILHDCRRTWASRAVSSGMPIALVMKIGGWSTKEDMEMLMRYLNLTDESNRASAAAYSAFIAQGQAAAMSQTTAAEMVN